MKDFSIWKRLAPKAALLVFGLALPAFADRPLGEADRFALLAGDQLVAWGPTVVNGRVGGRNQISGPFTFNGDQESGTALDSAIAAVAQARAEAAALEGERLRSGILSSVNVGEGAGVFPPGVYTFHGKASIRAAGITLKGTGNPNDTWVFNLTDNPATAAPRIEGSLMVSAGAEVRLTGGINTVANVYWNIAGPFAAGDNVKFRGTVMAGQTGVPGNVTFGQNCNVVGKLISVNGDVSTGANSVVNDSIIGTPPTLTLNPATTQYTINPGQTIQFSVNASDADGGDTVQLSVQNAPANAVIAQGLPRSGNPVGTNFSWTPTAADTGSRTVTFTAVDTNGLISTETISFSTTLNLPNPPTNLAAQVISRSEIRLTWTSGNAQPLAHRVERSVNGGLFEPLGGAVPAGTNTFSDTTVGANGTYTYRVRAENASGLSAPSNTASGSTLPLAPINFTLEPVASTQIDLHWQDPNPFPAAVKVERSLDAGQNWNFLKEVPAGTTTASDTGLTPNTTYFYRLSATGAAGDSETTSPGSVSTPGGGCVELTSPNLGAIWRIGTTATITWVDDGAGTHVKIEMSTDGGTRWKVIAARAPNNGTFRVKVNGPPTSTARIRIKSLTDPTCFDESTGNFRIAYGGKLEAPAQLDFGTVTTPRAVSKSLIIRNTSTTEILQITVPKLVAPFRGPVMRPTTILPGKSRALRLTFQPKAAGTFNANLVITSSDPARPTWTVALKGVGQAPKRRRR